MARPIASARRVERDELLDFLRPRHRGMLATRRRDGSPQLSPVTCGVDAQGWVTIATYPQRVKAINVRRDPHVSIVVQGDDWNGEYVQVDGFASVLDLPDAVEPLVDYFREISGEHPDWDEYRAAMTRQGKCIIRIEIDRWGPISTGGFPPDLAED